MLIYTQTIECLSDKRKFDLIYHTYRHMMYRRAYRILRNAQDAEDAVHEALITVSKNIEKFSDFVNHLTICALLVYNYIGLLNICKKGE